MRIFEAFFERANSLFYSDLHNERRVGVGKEPPGGQRERVWSREFFGNSEIAPSLFRYPREGNPFQFAGLAFLRIDRFGGQGASFDSRIRDIVDLKVNLASNDFRRRSSRNWQTYIETTLAEWSAVNET